MRQIIGKVVCTYINVFRAYVEAKMGCGVGASALGACLSSTVSTTHLLGYCSAVQ